jgi:hypothetical protein
MKVRIFNDSYTDGSIEEKINKWIDTENPDIRFIQQSESMTGNNDNGDGCYNFTVSVWYEPQK